MLSLTEFNTGGPCLRVINTIALPCTHQRHHAATTPVKYSHHQSIICWGIDHNPFVQTAHNADLFYIKQHSVDNSDEQGAHWHLQVSLHFSVMFHLTPFTLVWIRRFYQIKLTSFSRYKISAEHLLFKTCQYFWYEVIVLIIAPPK